MSLHNYLLFNLFGAAAMYANLSTINYFLAAHLLLIVRNRLPIPILIMLVSGSIPVYLGIKQLILLKSFKQLYFGEDNLFSSFNSVIDSSLYGQNYIENIGPIIHILLISISLFGLVSILIKKDYNNHWLNLLALNLFILLAILIENWLFGAMFPKERTGLFLLLLWALSIIFLWDYLHQIFPSSQKLEWPISIFLSLILVLHFYKSVNLQYCHTWKYDAHTKEILKIIEAKTHNDSTSLSNYYLFEPSLKYYIKTNQLKIRLTGTHEIKDNVNYVYRYQDTSYLPNYRLITQFYPIESNLMELVPN